MLQQWCSAADKNGSEQAFLARVKSTTLTDRAAPIINRIVWKYQHIIEKQSRQPDFTTFRWRRILDGLSLPVQLHPELRTPPEPNQEDTVLHQVDECCAPEEHLPSRMRLSGKKELWFACYLQTHKRMYTYRTSQLSHGFYNTPAPCALSQKATAPCDPIGSSDSHRQSCCRSSFPGKGPPHNVKG